MVMDVASAPQVKASQCTRGVCNASLPLLHISSGGECRLPRRDNADNNNNDSAAILCISSASSLEQPEKLWAKASCYSDDCPEFWTVTWLAAVTKAANTAQSCPGLQHSHTTRTQIIYCVHHSAHSERSLQPLLHQQTLKGRLCHWGPPGP